MPTLPLHRTQKAFIFGFHFGCVFLPMFLSLFNYRLIVFLLEICVNFLPQDAPLWQQMNEHLHVSQGHFHTYFTTFGHPNAYPSQQPSYLPVGLKFHEVTCKKCWFGTSKEPVESHEDAEIPPLSFSHAKS